MFRRRPGGVPVTCMLTHVHIGEKWAPCFHCQLTPSLLPEGLPRHCRGHRGCLVLMARPCPKGA